MKASYPQVRSVIIEALRRYDIRDDDIKQDAWVTALLADIAYKPEYGVPRWRWIRAKVCYGILDRLRRKTQLIGPVIDRAIEYRDCELWLIHESIHDAMKVLTPKQRDIIMQRYWMDRTLAEIARERNASAGSLWNLHDRALDRMREVLV